VIYLLGEGDPAEDRPDVPITKRTVEQLADAIQGDQFDDLDVVIQSSGGDIHAAYKMMSLLRGRMTGVGELVACVPGRAQSSATLLCLGADKILLGELGSLGPLDAQIRVGVTDVGTPDYTSALHLIKGLNRLQQFSLDTLNATAAGLYDRQVCRNDELLRHSIDFCRVIMAPLFERIESHKIGYWDQMLQTGEQYGRQLLARGKLIKNIEEADRDGHIRQVLHRLVYDYPSHESVILCDELDQELSLRAELIPAAIQPTVREFASCASETLVMLVYPPGVASPFISVPPARTLAEWKTLNVDDRAEGVSWSSAEGLFLMRIGLYRPKIIATRNPWREPGRPRTEGGPAAQFFASSSQAGRSVGAPPERRLLPGSGGAARPWPASDVSPGQAATGYTAYPRVDCPDVVVMDEPFDVEIGISPRRDRDVLSTGALTLPKDEFDLTVLLVYDPESLRIDGPPVRTLRVSEAIRYPSVIVRVTALDGEDLTPERRLGVHYLVNGAVVGFAWRPVIAVSDTAHLATAKRPDLRERELLDLGAVTREEAPDLVLAVFRADNTHAGRFSWAAYPTVPDVAVPDVKRSIPLDSTEAAHFAGNARRVLHHSDTAEATFDWLHGIAREIGRSIPEGITRVIRNVAELPGRTEPAAVLLLTEEVHVPWELAALSPPPATPFGGDSPFLGAHVAIGRWLLTERKPRLTPPRRVHVRSQAVFTAKYEGVARWPALPAAEQEAAELDRKYPPSNIVKPLYSNVMKCLHGDPPADVLHFALHGQFDPDGVDEGLVLLMPKPGGEFAPQYLQPQHVDSVDFGHRPFVFLNACQVGATKEVLGDYAGMAAAFLHAGAAGVIAPLWNVDDHIASALAHEFYRAAYSASAPSVADVLRRARARYTRAAAIAGATEADGHPTIGPTLIAYQFFGHPRLRLIRHPDADGEHDAEPTAS
jgi:hypothetical protein